MAIKSKKVRISPVERRKLRIKRKISVNAERPRITVFRSDKHTYAQLISADCGTTLASASTLDDEVKSISAEVAKRDGLRNKLASSKSENAARAVGIVLAKRALGLELKQVVFDRNGFLYLGRVRALADGAREGGLDF
jgi:large subunit ribosomal protein L18